MTVSVIVPIYNAEKYLADFFNALEKNDFSEGDQVILVDNGSTDSSWEICAKRALAKPGLYTHIKYTDKAGSYVARNYAVGLASGEILAFTDSDTKPCPNWISGIREKIGNNNVIAGRIELEIENGGLWELYDTIVHLNSEKNASECSVATANMAVRKTDFFNIGLFEDRFSGGDYDWSHRASEKGYTITFEPDVYVIHPTRKNFEQILKKEQRIAYGEGNHYRNSKKKYTTLYLRYLLKIFKIDTNIKCSYQLKKRGVSIRGLCNFNYNFMKIRVEQLKYAAYGYKLVDPRQLKVR